MKQTVLFAIAMMVSMGAGADVQNGKRLHDERCMKCHDDSVYTRKDHFVTSKEALAKQVNRCALNTGAQWSDEDVADVVDYLNASYYKFE
ncbi:MAG: cytochrome c [Chromatiales bacterium]|jgi:mono/diheme cytochrome c family protein|nr:cytochrome c [Chromatiales bacterium]